MEERRTNWKATLSKDQIHRQRKVQDLLSERNKIQREMNACDKCDYEKYSGLLAELRENAAKLAAA